MVFFISLNSLTEIFSAPRAFLGLSWVNYFLSKNISNDQELIQSDPTSCPQNQKGNN